MARAPSLLFVMTRVLPQYPVSSSPPATALASEILDIMLDGVYFVDTERRITFWSQGATRLTGYQAKDVVGHFCFNGILRHVDDAGTKLCGNGCPLLACIQDGATRECTVWLHHAEGHRVPVVVRAAALRDSAGTITGAVEVFSDATAFKALEQRQQELERLALLDPLTGVGNRRHLQQELRARLEEYRRYGWPMGVLLVDVDHFKHVNDRWGHDMGDEVLRAVSRTMAAAVRGFDCVGRWGGEEFLVLLRNVDEAGLIEAAERLRVLVGACSIPIGHDTASVTISIGATLLVSEDDEATVVKRADHATYASKQTGRNRVTLQLAAAGRASDARVA